MERNNYKKTSVLIIYILIGANLFAQKDEVGKSPWGPDDEIGT